MDLNFTKSLVDALKGLKPYIDSPYLNLKTEHLIFIPNSNTKNRISDKKTTKILLERKCAKC